MMEECTWKYRKERSACFITHVNYGLMRVWGDYEI